MANKKMHLIKYGPLKFHITDTWQTECGEYFWSTWQGTTDREHVKCERCLKIMKKCTASPGRKMK